ncbi:ester cyclase [Antrihabitans cavernicola]|uniref:Ester cyclase n=1 Tax=Antrihabitans cavernicola TaxID=2495913 RepID=A0A5A7SJV6_9NOCA|nr:ester cyclase [Spelaeibacter cavernicola]KAA0024933.1 ester cyclase [Spelaeibacter cavernicola]
MTSTTLTAATLAQKWTDLWNGELDLSARILTDDFVIRFGSAASVPADALRGGAQFAEFVDNFRATRPGLTFTVDGAPAGTLDSSGNGRFAICWFVDLPEQPRRSGIDLFDAVDGRIVRVWSVTAEREFGAV